ncbi:chondroitin sulfate N-acetylgalactosaminyltransferase 2-like [Babylonia areolata]|uniref:chondroitin sulfate N-acetylgalactosaminyltransferase 2-like n=1 Tax=Babylonia areolata TaxID=304850 RepID=UPI003FD46E7D
MRAMPRVLLLLFSLSVLTMMFVARCGLNMDAHLHQPPTRGLPHTMVRAQADTSANYNHLKQVMRQREAQHSQERSRLEDKIRSLESQLHAMKQGRLTNNTTTTTSTTTTTKRRPRTSSHPPPLPVPPSRSQALQQTKGSQQLVSNMSTQDVFSYFIERLQSAEITKGISYKTEYEIIPFNRFTLTRIYLVEPGLGKRVIEKPIGYKKKDLYEIIAYGIDKLNGNRTGGQTLYSYDDFVEGIHRTEPTTGAHYELYFQNKDSAQDVKMTYVKVVVFRPFGPPMLITSDLTYIKAQWINLILPLSGRLETFRYFMERFTTVCIKHDKRVYLTVVYFGTEGLKEVKTIMSNAARQHKYKHMKLITLNEKFARGRGLQIGALNWKSGDVLLFMCDVDIIFGEDFLERCRMNTEQEKRVYYPIVFSLYNPKIVYSLQDIPTPSLAEQLVISKDTGFWRDFGYGMTCQYRSDFLKIKGFDEQIQGWGGEDVFLYQKFVRSEYLVIRATDPGIFHLWHEKFCDPKLSPEQYRSCIRSKALNEASHSQLGLLAFKDEIDVHRSSLNRVEIKEQAIL